MSRVEAWDTELASERAREAYRYVARMMPKDADLDVLAPHEDAAIAGRRVDVTKGRLAFGGVFRSIVFRGCLLPLEATVKSKESRRMEKIAYRGSKRGGDHLFFGRNRKHEFADRRVDERIG